MLGPTASTFVAWLLGTVGFVVLFTPHEHGSGLIYAAAVLVLGVVGGIVHAVLVWRRERRKLIATDGEMTSNRAPHRDGREASHFDQPPRAPARGRER